jgi:hypothetical protein
MATKRGSKPRRAASPKKARAGSNGKNRDDIVLGPVISSKQRVPIDAKSYARKESEIAQLEVKVKKLRAKIKPDQVLIAEHRKTISELTEDIEDETEERDVKVQNEYHFKTSEVRVLRAGDLKEIDRRTMTTEELKRTSDVEDRKLKAPIDRGTAAEPEEQSESGKKAQELMGRDGEDDGEVEPTTTV